MSDALPSPPRRPRRRDRARWRATLARIEYLGDKLVQIEEAIETLLDADRVNAAGLAALITRSIDVRGSLDAELAAQPDRLEGATAEELVEFHRKALEEQPDQLLEAAFAVYGERHRGRFIFVGEGGHRTEYVPGEGWQAS